MLTPQQRQQEVQRLYMRYFNNELTAKHLVELLLCFEEYSPVIYTFKNMKKEALMILCQSKGISFLGKKDDLIVRLFFNE